MVIVPEIYIVQNHIVMDNSNNIIDNLSSHDNNFRLYIKHSFVLCTYTLLHYIFILHTKSTVLHNMVLHLYMGFIQVECYIICTVESQTPLKQISVEHKLVLKHYLIKSNHKNTLGAYLVILSFYTQ